MLQLACVSYLFPSTLVHEISIKLGFSFSRPPSMLSVWLCIVSFISTHSINSWELLFFTMTHPRGTSRRGARHGADKEVVSPRKGKAVNNGYDSSVSALFCALIDDLESGQC